MAAWYFSQVVPTSIGVAKPWYFVFLPSYWIPNPIANRDAAVFEDVQNNLAKTIELDDVSTIPRELVNENILGSPTIRINGMTKTYGSTKVVNNIKLAMYENQIFALLGHNGAVSWASCGLGCVLMCFMYAGKVYNYQHVDWIDSTGLKQLWRYFRLWLLNQR